MGPKIMIYLYSREESKIQHSCSFFINTLRLVLLHNNEFNYWNF
jgi:hypothetical protein